MSELSAALIADGFWVVVVVVVVVEPGKIAGNIAAPMAPIAMPTGNAIASMGVSQMKII